MSIRKLVAALAAVVVTAAGLVSSTGTAHATIPRPTLAAPAQVKTGQAFTLTAWPHRAGKVVLQRRVSGSWAAVAHQRSSGRKVVFRRTEHSAGTVSYRVRVGTRYSTTHRVRVVKPVLPAQLSITLGSNGDIYVGDTYSVDIEAFKGSTPLVGRAVIVQRMDPGKSAWTTVGTYTTGSDGAVSFTDSEQTSGLVQYRATSGTLSAFTRAPIFQLLMIAGPGSGGVSVQKSGCGASVSGGGGDLTFSLAGTSKPACAVQAGDWVQVTWNLPKGFSGGCTPVQFGNFAVSGGGATVSISIDGQSFPYTPGSGKFSVNGDPMTQVVIRMTASSNNNVLTGQLSGAQAVCF